jgi:hypothetical protein
VYAACRRYFLASGDKGLLAYALTFRLIAQAGLGESFKRWMTDTVFGLTYEGTSP